MFDLMRISLFAKDKLDGAISGCSTLCLAFVMRPSLSTVVSVVADTKLCGWQTESGVCCNLVRAILEVELAVVQCRIHGGKSRFLFDAIVLFPGDVMEAELAICVT